MNHPIGQQQHTVLRVTDLVKRFPLGRGAHGSHISAVEGVNLSLRHGQTLGIVGESGCGKSTLARLLAALDKPTSGTVEVFDRNLLRLHGRQLRWARRDIQMIFQDPLSSLNPRMAVGDIVKEPFDIHTDIVIRKRRRERALELLELVGLNPDQADRLPSQLSGGQRQRVGIARALALRPQILVCDEPVSALDVSVQAQIINLLQDLQYEFGLSYVFIAHDLSIVQHIADHTMVMYLGKIVESAEGDQMYDRPAHPYTQALLAAAPSVEVSLERHASSLPEKMESDLPSAANPPSGCRFRTRCWKAQSICAEQEPLLAVRPASTGHQVACHFPNNA